MKKLFSLLLAALVLLCCVSPAMAESITLNGVVVATQTETLSSTLTGTVDEVLVAVGDHVKAGDKIATIKTTQVLATYSGTVYLFGEAGDTADYLTTRYGAVAYVEPDYTYTISASTKNAYDAEENRIIHPGEVVYLRGYSDTTHQGTGLVTAVSGTSYTVEVTDGNFDSSESVVVYRDSAFTTSSRIGRGNTAKVDPIAYSSTGTVVRYCVENGQNVQKGDVLFETVEGTVENGQAVIIAPKDGVITTLSIAPGTVVTQGDAVAQMYADAALRIEASALESDLNQLVPGAAVTIEHMYNEELLLTGTIEKIAQSPITATADESTAATSESEEASYSVIILPDHVDALLYGMNVLVYTPDDNTASEPVG